MATTKIDGTRATTNIDSTSTRATTNIDSTSTRATTNIDSTSTRATTNIDSTSTRATTNIDSTSTRTKVGGVAYVLGLAAWVTPWLGRMHEDLLEGSAELPAEAMLFPSAIAALLMIATSLLMSWARRLSSVVLLAALGTSLVFALTSITTHVLDVAGANTMDLASCSHRTLVGAVFGGPLGLALSVPAVVIAAAHEAGPRSHDDRDLFTAFTGGWVMLASLFAVALTVSDPHAPYPWLSETVEMLAMNAGAVILSLGVGGLLLRRQWLTRARRGELDGVRVRRLGILESPPAVLPLLSTSGTARELSVIEVVIRPAVGAYRTAEVVQPIAIV